MNIEPSNTEQPALSTSKQNDQLMDVATSELLEDLYLHLQECAKIARVLRYKPIYALANQPTEADEGADAVLSNLVAYVQKHRAFRGTASDLLEVINLSALPEQRKLQAWPANAIHLGITLSRIAPLLKKNGVVFLRNAGHAKGRKIILRCLNQDEIAENTD